MLQESEIKVQFGTKIRYLREQRNISQEKLGDLCGLDRTYVSSVERGRRNVSLVNIFRLAKGLDVPAHELLSSEGGAK